MYWFNQTNWLNVVLCPLLQWYGIFDTWYIFDALISDHTIFWWRSRPVKSQISTILSQPISKSHGRFIHPACQAVLNLKYAKTFLESTAIINFDFLHAKKEIGQIFSSICLCTCFAVPLKKYRIYLLRILSVNFY